MANRAPVSSIAQLAVASMWNDVLGVETSSLNQEWKVFLDTRRRKVDTEVFRAGWMPLHFYVTTRLVKPWAEGFEQNIMNHHHSKHLRILAH